MTAKMPAYDDLLWPTLEVLKKGGGSAFIQELLEHVTRDLALPDDVSDVPHGDGPQTEVAYRRRVLLAAVVRAGPSVG